MNVPTNNVQIIRQGGKPAFAVIPYSDYLQLTGETSRETTIPHQVVELVIDNGWNLVKAWRKHLGLKQTVLAKRVGISQPALSQRERGENLRNETLEKLAQAMGIAIGQLID